MNKFLSEHASYADGFELRHGRFRRYFAEKLQLDFAHGLALPEWHQLLPPRLRDRWAATEEAVYWRSPLADRRHGSSKLLLDFWSTNRRYGIFYRSCFISFWNNKDSFCLKCTCSGYQVSRKTKVAWFWICCLRQSGGCWDCAPPPSSPRDQLESCWRKTRRLTRRKFCKSRALKMFSRQHRLVVGRNDAEWIIFVLMCAVYRLESVLNNFD